MAQTPISDGSVVTSQIPRRVSLVDLQSRELAAMADRQMAERQALADKHMSEATNGVQPAAKELAGSESEGGDVAEGGPEGGPEGEAGGSAGQA